MSEEMEQMWRPVLMERRWHWIVSGLINFLVVFVFALIFWYAFIDWRFSPFKWWFFLGSAIAGWGILVVVSQIWYDHYPYNRIKSFIGQAIAGTITNVVIVAIIFAFFWFIVGPYMIPMFSPFALMNISTYASDPLLALFLSSSAIGSILACGFSFATIWAAGGMYWPFTELKQPKRGFAVFLMGALITMATWLFLFWPFQIATAFPPTVTTVDWTIWTALPFWSSDNSGAYTSLAFTQWIITFGMLTLMSWEYKPWTALKKQPWIGLGALIGCSLIGGIVAFFVMPPLIGLMGYTGAAQYAFSTWIAVFITTMIVIWSQYFDNWPRSFSAPINLVLRTVIVFILGYLSLWIYFIIAPGLLGDIPIIAYSPLTWLLWLLWFMLIHIYIFKRAPGWKSV